MREEAERRRLLSDEHFTVDGTLLEAWASVKSFRPNDEKDDGAKPGGRNPNVSFHGTQRSNATHHSRTDPEARLARTSNGTTAKMSYMGHALMENRHGLVVDVELTAANGHAERTAALAMLSSRRRQRGEGADGRSVVTRDMTPATSSTVSAPWVSPRMSPRTHRTGAAPLTDARAIATATQ